ncbi:MAG: PEP-CTERM sorting domain-containing protein [Planctomycetes bacterium]|nr:PEP-CTERM sorting domain-containing protein [Planctomycetota bacterium]
MRPVLLSMAALACLSAAVVAAPNFHDDFEAGVGGTNTWYNWRSSPDPWPPPNPSGINNLLTTSTDHNHTPAGTKSARAWESDPAAWNAYSDFGADSGTIHTDAWLFEDFTHDGTNSAQPVTNMLSLYGDGANPGVFTDYIQIGVVPFYPSGSVRYGFRTRYNDSTGGGIIDTGVSRKPGWTHLAIDVDAMGLGGQIRFFIDGTQVGTSYRAGANGGAGGLSPVALRWVRLGNNSKSYENFWYDDVNVTPEPASLLLLGLGGIALLRRNRRA